MPSRKNATAKATALAAKPARTPAAAKKAPETKAPPAKRAAAVKQASRTSARAAKNSPPEQQKRSGSARPSTSKGRDSATKRTASSPPKSAARRAASAAKSKAHKRQRSPTLSEEGCSQSHRSSSDDSSVTALASSLFPALTWGAHPSEASKAATAPVTLPAHAEGHTDRRDSPTTTLTKAGPILSSQSSQVFVSTITAATVTEARAPDATPPRRCQTRIDADGDTEKGGSPEALTVSSEGRRSSTLWQQRLLSATPAGTQSEITSATDATSMSPPVNATDTTRAGDHDGDDDEVPVVPAREDAARQSGVLSTGATGRGHAGVVTALFGSAARAIACDTVLFIEEEEEGNATPPTAPSSQFLSIPDASLTQTQRGATTGVPPMPYREVATPHIDASVAFPTTLAPTAGRQPSPPVAARISTTPTPSQSPGTHLRMRTPSRPRSPAASVATRANHAGGLPLPPSTMSSNGRRSFPAAPQRQRDQQRASSSSMSNSSPPPPPTTSSSASSTNTTQPLSGVATTATAIMGNATTRNSSSYATPVSRTGPPLPQRQALRANTMDLISPSRGRLSTQLITRAAVARPAASPGTMWICLDDEDDADVAEPTSPTSPTLKNIRIEAATTEGSSHHDSSQNPGGGDDRGGETITKRYTREDELEEVDGTDDSGATQRLFENVPDLIRRSRKIYELGTRGDGNGFVHSDQSIRSGPRNALADTTYGATTARDPQQQQQQQQQQATAAATVAPEKGTIGQILSPTFRPRRGAALPPLPANAFICMDDSDSQLSSPANSEEKDDENKEESEGRSSASSVDIPLAHLYDLPSSEKPLDGITVTAVVAATSTASYRVPSSSPRPTLIIDDDDDEERKGERVGNTKAMTDSMKEKGAHFSSEMPPAKHTGTDAAEGNQEERASPVRSVKDFIFPDRNGARSPLFPFSNDDALGDLFPSRHEKGEGSAGAVSTATKLTAAATLSGGGKSKKGRRSSDGAEKHSNTSHRGRPVDQLWQFFPSRFTKKSFHDAARRIIPAEHFLDKGQFWDAFDRVEFVGEGSFGLVWRCATVDGDLVAVKSCPVKLHSRANIEDAFSTLREIAVMRFLNEMQVPYVLPLHSAFTVNEQDSLPPLAAEALAWRRQLRRTAEAAVLERHVQALSAGGHGRKNTAARNSSSNDGGLASAIEKELAAMEAVESEEEKSTRARLGSVRLPRFLSISEEDVLQCDATVLLVFELCDGDLESIPRADGVAKGVAYCVSSALAAMHDLGLLHLDLKPSNILFAYEHGPSQQTPRASTMLTAADSAGVVGHPTTRVGTQSMTMMANNSNTNSIRAVKFYLSDFGNCRIVGPRPDDAVEDAFGTFEYMDLRALRDATCDRATDNFSLGCSLYEMLFGKRVYPRCASKRCRADEDHTRECFIEAAATPIVLPLSAAAAAAAGGDWEDASRNGQHAKHDAHAAHKIPLTTLQKVVAALLRPDREQRMTAAQCRDHVVKVYSITQAHGSPKADVL